ncbi:restriction endonuclease subunit S [Helicobacter pylori]|uniref:Restriction endonuclease subunit S n=2 Tax=Helicobacter pylori TaxID=210 RepID=A0AAE7PGW1_HELPX|nr:restriction endonuclease subunit S [Helicobacter pylori]AFI01730.1 type I R-M system specificity subunit [Helicobacter pylori Shi112]QQW94322.1 restriction endonuclease subunit S [Helicobacter pylori]QQX50289.1 restriction endonuclease subunit S [Helicobacter pylori]
MNTLTAFYDLPKEWEVVRLLDITHIFDGTHQTPQYTHHGVAFFSVENIANNKPNKFISQQDYLIATSKNKPEYNDILLTRIGAIGISKVVSWTYPFSIYVTLAVIKQSKYFNSYYLHYFIQSSFFQKELKDNSLLQAIPCKINMDKLKKCKVILPPLNEQIAIANILSALDRYLYALDALILKKEGVKKALSFELLSQRKRLKGFNQAWQRVRLGDIANYLTSNLSVEQITQQGKIKVYDVNNFIGYTDTTFISDKPYISIVKDGSVGRVRILPPKTNILSTMGALIANHRTTTEFLFYLLSNFDFKNFTSGSIIPHIYFKDYKEKTIFLPPLNEQIAIANILSALDNEITSLKNKKRQFENIKKALNHDLMSAKIRVLKK